MLIIDVLKEAIRADPLTSRRNWGAFVPIPIELVTRPIELIYDAVKDVVVVEKEAILDTNAEFAEICDVVNWNAPIELVFRELVRRLFVSSVLVLIVLVVILLAKIVLAKMELVLRIRLLAIVVVRLLVFRNIELTKFVEILDKIA